MPQLLTVDLEGSIPGVGWFNEDEKIILGILEKVSWKIGPNYKLDLCPTLIHRDGIRFPSDVLYIAAIKPQTWRSAILGYSA